MSNQRLSFQSGFCDITPTSPVQLAGYSCRSTPFDGIADRLEANAVVIHTRPTPLVLISFDLMYVGAYLRGLLEQAFASLLRPEDLFLAASHTHFAPGVDSSLPRLGPCDARYVEMVAHKVIELVRRLLRAEPEPLETGTAIGRADHSINRRRLVWRPCSRYPFVRRKMVMGPNLLGMRDESVRVVRFGSRAVLWNYACHPVFMPRLNHVSADYIGAVRQAVRARYGSETAVLFWQGFSGNIFPSFVSKLVSLPARLKRRLFGGLPVVPADLWTTWSGVLARVVTNAVDDITMRQVIGGCRSSRVALPIRQLLGPEAPEKSLVAHELCIGTDLHAIGVSAEVLVEYVPLFQKQLDDPNLICVGCTDGVFGYLPCAATLREGGYEAGEFIPHFNLSGAFSSRVEEIVVQQLLTQLLRQAA